MFLIFKDKVNVAKGRDQKKKKSDIYHFGL